MEKFNQEIKNLTEGMIEQKLGMLEILLSAGYYLKDYFIQNPDMMTKGQVRLSKDAQTGEVIEVDTTMALVKALFSMARNTQTDLEGLGAENEANKIIAKVLEVHGRDRKKTED